MKKINLTDPAVWQQLNWDDPTAPDLLKKSDRAVSIARQNRLRAQDPLFIEKLKLGQKKALEDPSKLKSRNKAAKRGGQTKKDSKEYQQLMTEVNRKKAQDPTHKEKVRKGILKKQKDPTYQENRKKHHLSKQKPIKDPNGKIWASRKEAAEGWNVRPQALSRLANISKSGWEYV